MAVFDPPASRGAVSKEGENLVAKRIAIALSLMAFAAVPNVFAQGGRGGPPGPPPTPKAAARIDITGYWVSLVTEDWRFRQFTPPKGDITSVPLNAAGKKIAEAWDPAKDEAAEIGRAHV